MFYVWQNVEIMKINLKYQQRSEEEIDLLQEKDYLIYKLERSKRRELVKKYALEHEYKIITMEDIEIQE